MSTRPLVMAVAFVLVCAFVVYRMSDTPERKIRRILDDVAAALSHDEPVSGLGAVTPATSLQEHLAPDVTIDAGMPIGVLTGAPDVVAGAVRLRLATLMMRIDFVDVQIAVMNDASATLHATVKITSRGRSGNETVDAREFLASLTQHEGRWVLSRVQTIPVLEPVL